MKKTDEMDGAKEAEKAEKPAIESPSASPALPLVPSPRPETLPILPEVPAGFREMTKDEHRQVSDIGFQIALSQETQARLKAEIDLRVSQFNAEQNQIAAIRTKMDGLRKKLGAPKPGDIVLVKDKLYVKKTKAK
jgi:hypothetical protein